MVPDGRDAIGIVSWLPGTRVVGGEYFTWRNRIFVQAAEVVGRFHLTIIAYVSLMDASVALLDSALSFLGLDDFNLIRSVFIVSFSRSVIRFA